MRLAHCAAAAVALALALPAPAAALDDGLAPTPPMGWNPWNRFGCEADQRLVREVADAIVATGMRDAGYRQVNLDDCWMARARGPAGELRADPERFAAGIPELAAYLHARGLRLGLYTSLGSETCEGRPALAGHERADLRRMASWGMDYLKVDFCGANAGVRADPEPAYARVSELLRETGRPIVLSMCSWGVGRPWSWGPAIGHLWRVTGDIADDWDSVMRVAARARSRWAAAGPGGWNDPDMLQVGNGGMTAREDRAHFSLWAVMAAPLLAGNDPRRMTAATRRTLLNREVLAVDQDPEGAQGRRVRARNGLEVWLKPLRGSGGAVLLLNRSPARATLRVDLRRLGFPAATRYRVRNLWRHRTGRRGPILRKSVPAHGAALYRVRPLP